MGGGCSSCGCNEERSEFTIGSEVKTGSHDQLKLQND